jgi:hypothetical protein
MSKITEEWMTVMERTSINRAWRRIFGYKRAEGPGVR